MKFVALVLSTFLAFGSFALANVSPLSSPMTKISTAEKDEIRKTIRGTVRMAGTWTGGGGEGVICFKSKEVKEASFDEEKRLKPVAIMSKTTLQVWDMAEQNRGQAPLLPRAGDNVKTYLDYIVKENIEYGSPYFAFRVRQALALILNEDGTVNWEDRGPLAKLDDAGPRRIQIKPETCEMIQIVARYQRPGKNGQPEVFIDYDKNLFDHIGEDHPAIKIMSQAMLILHEALWLAGVEIGMPDSSRTRELNWLLMSRDLKKYLDQKGSHRRQLMFTTLIYSLRFRNVNALFVDPNAADEPYSTGSRQRARAELAVVYRENASELLKSGKIQPGCSPLNSKYCDYTILRSLAPKLNPEQTFLFLVASMANSKKIRFSDDTFLMPGDQLEAAREVCQAIAVDASQTKSDDPWALFQPAALSYCAGWVGNK
jgi:hypothetical protein